MIGIAEYIWSLLGSPVSSIVTIPFAIDLAKDSQGPNVFYGFLVSSMVSVVVE